MTRALSCPGEAAVEYRVGKLRHRARDVHTVTLCAVWSRARAAGSAFEGLSQCYCSRLVGGRGFAATSASSHARGEGEMPRILP